MKKATIDNLAQVDRIANHWCRAAQEHSILEIHINTRAKIHERVRLPQIGAERTVIASRMVHNLRVVHITAAEWQYLRGTTKANDHELARARALTIEATHDAPRVRHHKSRSGTV